MLRTVQFKCPNCGALYQVVKGEAGPETDDRQITCRPAARHLLAAMDGSSSNISFLRLPAR